MKEELESKGLSLGPAFLDTVYIILPRCVRTVLKFSDSLIKKCSKLKERIIVLARRACDQSEHGLPATAAIAPVTPVTPSRKRNLDESQWGALQRGAHPEETN